eukprot:TRINITY_DN16088_c0_g1_i1.p1 TRINITY_DN16088_c0_g1~~TRINITY_DN16088_c0_g1_i1.p1  ORF type:complete len:306 (+),score=51.31 TRINITY_DN16088_c0_g1_i1:52-969(+)
MEMSGFGAALLPPAPDDGSGDSQAEQTPEPAAELNLEGEELDAEQVSQLTALLKSNAALTALNLDDNHDSISIAQLENLIHALEDNTNLLSLKIGNCVNDADDDDDEEEDGERPSTRLARALKAMLSKNRTLRALHIQENKLIDSDVSILCHGLRANPNSGLRFLKVYGNPFGELGVYGLANAIKSSQSLVALDTRYTYMGSQGAGYFADALKTNTTLRQLDLQGNNIGEDGARALVAAMESNQSLTFLNVPGMFLDEQLAITLATALKRNKDQAGNDASQPQYARRSASGQVVAQSPMIDMSKV